MTWMRARHEGINYDKIHGDSSYRFLRTPVPGTLHTRSAAFLSTVEGAGSIYGPLYVQEETVPDMTHLPEDKGCHIGCNEAILGEMALPSCEISEPLEPWLRCQSTRGGGLGGAGLWQTFLAAGGHTGALSCRVKDRYIFCHGNLRHKSGTA